MKFRLIVQDGIKFTEEIDYALIQTEDGQFAILDKHIPVVTSVNSSGFIKLVNNNVVSFVVVDRATVVFKQSQLDVFSLHAQIGATLEKAVAAFLRESSAQQEASKRENVDFSKQERELRENIMKAKAGHI